MENSNAAEQTKRRRESLLRLVEPLREQLEEIEAQLKELDETARVLREERRELLAVLKVADPEMREKSKQAPKGSKQSYRTRVSAEKLDALRDWLREHRHEFPDGVSVPELKGRGAPISDHQFTYALPALAERGDLRIDGIKRGGHGTPPKVYKLVAP